MRGLPTLAIALWLPGAAAHAQPCADNFASSGSALRGYTHKTQAVLPGAVPLVVYAAVLTNMAGEGWRIIESNPDSGEISALRTESGRQRLAAPVRALVLPHEEGVSVSFRLSITGAPGRRADGVRDTFCRLLDGVNEVG